MVGLQLSIGLMTVYRLLVLLQIMQSQAEEVGLRKVLTRVGTGLSSRRERLESRGSGY